MSYSQYASSITSNATEVSSKAESITQVEIDSIWEGTAHDKQKGYLTDLESAVAVQVSQMNALASVLSLIDDYDKKTSNIEWYLEKRDNLNKNAINYLEAYESYSELAKNEITAKSEIKTKINGILNGITESYTEKIVKVSPTEVVSTYDIFKEFEENMNGVSSSSFDISNTVTPVSVSNLTGDTSQPNFNNYDAWQGQNPYAWSNLYGQCTWFAWGRFYEIYGYSPGFTGNGKDCAGQLVNAHSDKFYLSDTPVVGSVFSIQEAGGCGHVGIVVGVDYENNKITIQDGNYNGKTDSFSVAQSDWGTLTYDLSEFNQKRDGVVYANPITTA